MCETFDQVCTCFQVWCCSTKLLLILVLERIREQIDIFQGSRENEKLQGSKREKMQGAREKIRREQGEWTKIRREQGARTPPLRASLMLSPCKLDQFQFESRYLRIIFTFPYRPILNTVINCKYLRKPDKICPYLDMHEKSWSWISNPSHPLTFSLPENIAQVD